MKKIYTVITALLIFTGTFSQTQIEKGKYALDFNTGLNGLGEGGISFMQGTTSLYITAIDDFSIYNIGLDAGYFIQEGLALKAGLGYGGIKESGADGYNSFSYRLGLKYYISNSFPIQVDLTGAQIKDAEDNPLWLGLQGGYAFFLGDSVSIEPGFRYSLSLNEDFTDDNIFQFNVGVSIFL